MQLQFYIAGAGAGLLTSILDISKNPANGTVIRLGSSLDQGLFHGANVYLSPNFWAIILIVLVSIFVCWIFEVTSRLDAFLRGCTILAAFSIGAPDPIINNQRDQTSFESGGPQAPIAPQVPSKKGSLQFFSTAFAADNSEADRDIPLGTAYIVLSNLQKLSSIPPSIVTVQDPTTLEKVAAFKTDSYRLELTEPYGRYLVQVATVGYSAITFDVSISESVSAFVAAAPQSSIPLALQRLGLPTKIALMVDNAEKYKQLGRRETKARNFLGAIPLYQKSLSLDPTDIETKNFLAYAYYRGQKLAEAQQMLVDLLRVQPQNNVSRLNYLKVLCSEGKNTDAQSFFQQGFIRQKEIWAADGEFMRVCAPILPP